MRDPSPCPTPTAHAGPGAARIEAPSAAPLAERDSAPAAAPIDFAPATRQNPARVCVIAEIGVNHDGSISRALELIEAAAHAGANAVKFQLFNPRHLLSNQARLAVYQETTTDNLFEMLDELKLSPDDLLAARVMARRMGIGFAVTPFSLEDIPALKMLDVDAVKIASPDAINTPLLRAASDLGRPMLVSTGTEELDELEFVAKLLSLRSTRGCLLQCVSSYPAPLDQTSLGAISVLSQRFGLPAGYSDHTTELFTGALAVAAGACLIEKHLTYNRAAVGPDHAASFDPDQFETYVAMVRQAAAMVGPRHKFCLPAEADVRFVARQSVCLKRNLPAGHVLGYEDLTVKRPGPPEAVPAAQLDQVVGRKLARNVKANDLLLQADMAG